MGLYSEGVIIERKFASEIWGHISGGLMFGLGGGGGGEGAYYYRNFTVFVNRRNLLIFLMKGYQILFLGQKVNMNIYRRI